MKITTDEEHTEALKILGDLIDDINSSDVDLQALSKDIESYENKRCGQLRNSPQLGC